MMRDDSWRSLSHGFSCRVVMFSSPSSCDGERIEMLVYARTRSLLSSHWLSISE